MATISLRSLRVLPRSAAILMQAPSLRGALVRTISFTVGVMLVLIGVGVYFYTSINERQTWHQRQMDAATFAGDTVADYLVRIQDYLVLVGTLPEEQLVQSQDVLTKYLSDNSAVLEVVRTNQLGEFVAAAHFDAPVLANLFTVGQSVWHRVARGGEFYIGSLQVTYDGEPYAIMAVPSADGGVVAARLRMRYLWDIVGELRFGQTGGAYVITPDGTVIAHAVPDVVLANTTLAGRPELATILETASTYLQVGYENFAGVRVLGMSRTIPGTNWLMVTELPSAEADALSRQTLVFVSLAIMLSGFLVTLLTYRRLQSLVLQPIVALRVAASRVAKGEFTQLVDVVRKDEVGMVTLAFNQMMTDLAHREIELAAAAAMERELVERKRYQHHMEYLNRRLEKRQRELERMTEDLMRSNRELQEFAYVASHDLQEPLRKVRAFGDRLVERYATELDDRGRDYIQRMQNAAQRMQTLIDALLTYSRVTSKAQPFGPVDLNEVVSDVLSDLEARLAQTGGHVTVSELAVVNADGVQLRQLVQNLLGNALKFHKPDVPPQIRIEGEWLDTDADGDDSTQAGPLQESPARVYRLTIQDNGVGFDPQYATRIFNVFERLHGRSEYEGTGIGLAICRKIAERHGGQIVAVSAPNEGATFIVTLTNRPLRAQNQDEDRSSETIKNQEGAL